MKKFNLPLNRYFFANINPLIHKWVVNLQKLYKNDKFGYLIISQEIHNKKFKFIKKTFSFLNLNSRKNYAIFLPYKKHNKLKIKHQTILLFENCVDNGIYIYEII